MMKTKTEEERSDLWRRDTEGLTGISRAKTEDFQNSIRSEALNLRAEVLRRNPNTPKAAHGEDLPLVYGSLAGPEPLNGVADYLAAIVRSLP